MSINRLPRKARKANTKADTKPEKKKKKSLAEMTIADVLQTGIYFQQITAVMQTIERAKMHRNEIAELKMRDKWSAGEMIVMYAQCNEKVLQGFSKRMRGFILQIGLRAFNNTMVHLKNIEKCESEK